MKINPLVCSKTCGLTHACEKKDIWKKYQPSNLLLCPVLGKTLKDSF
jgi:hypothetical protein